MSWKDWVSKQLKLGWVQGPYHSMGRVLHVHPLRGRYDLLRTSHLACNQSGA